MTITLWLMIGWAIALIVFAAGWLLGSRWTFRQLERDTHGWQHSPFDKSAPTQPVEGDWHRRSGW